jgi:hypothetical protein
MLERLYLAECSSTYRRLIPRLVEGYVREVVDLWEEPTRSIPAEDLHVMLMVDEAFVVRGPGPARSAISSLLQPRKIVTIPVIFLMRRERPFGELPYGLHLLRRPFYSEDLENILKFICPEGRKIEEVIMSEDQYSNSAEAPILPPVSSLDEEALKNITREAVEKAVREILPALAEKIIREEIRRLTE